MADAKTIDCATRKQAGGRHCAFGVRLNIARPFATDKEWRGGSSDSHTTHCKGELPIECDEPGIAIDGRESVCHASAPLRSRHRSGHVCGAGPLLGARQTASRKGEQATRAPSAATIPTPEVTMPFRIGEKLDYRVAWASFANAASIELTVPERRDLMGWGTWHFRASAHTLNPMRRLVTVDDQFDSYTDAATLESRQYETYLNEMGRSRTEFFISCQKANPREAQLAGVVVSPGTRDPLGAAYALRGVDWAQTPEVPGARLRRHTTCTTCGRDLRFRHETVAVAAGNFPTSKISIRLFQRGKEVAGNELSRRGWRTTRREHRC